MSVEMYLISKKPTQGIIKKWTESFANYNMTFELHPDFSFEEHSGFLPIKIKFNKHENPEIEGIDIITGFELDITDFNSEEIEEEMSKKDKNRIENAETRLTFSFGGYDMFDTRVAILSLVILAEILEGVIFDPQEGTIVQSKESLIEGIAMFEDFAMEENIEINRFEGWE